MNFVMVLISSAVGGGSCPVQSQIWQDCPARLIPTEARLRAHGQRYLPEEVATPGNQKGKAMTMSRRQSKNEILKILGSSEFGEAWPRLKHYPPARLLNPLFSALCSIRDRVRWNSVQVFGRLVPFLADTDLESARVVMRRFLWSLNDESGGIGWGAPEAMAEILCHSEVLRSEYLHMLLSYMAEDGEELFQDGNYLELPLLQRGLLWGIGRLAEMHGEEMLARGADTAVAAYLDSVDHQVVGLAIRALAFLGSGEARQKIAACTGSTLPVTVFTGQETKEISLGEIATWALAVLDARLTTVQA
jgi:hypothetical protein